MSDYELGMKIVEEDELDLFLEAYEDATGQRLEVLAPSERPDFLCRRESGDLVGVELTSVRRDPASVVAGRILSNEEFADPHYALERIEVAIEAKDSKRARGEWDCRDSTILVLQADCQLADLAKRLDDLGPEEFVGHGFEEIWIADNPELAGYNAVELFCLYPEELWGYYERDRGKPYG